MHAPLLRKIIILQLSLIITISEATSFGCKDTLISDEWRKAVLDYHNRIRRRVAEGKQPTGAAGKFMPAAGEIFELNWDCDMENNAYLSTCDQNTVPIPANYGANRAALTMKGDMCNIKDNTMAVLKNWYSQATALDLSADALYNDTLQREFGIMIFRYSSGLACSYSHCPGSGGKLLCLYNLFV
ncbi:hypothetical protein ANCCEY_09848 [Ancylostoma ceylanicum]|uniref:SCP domain-containing protein n=1 Tax=Ancylostoma ceylanicum TaxID=53326 RepID=A0A0D6LLY7_9BILA|nr:hypothetical protein ANCCEY_09848 [Ancylostoma ceylanicum]